MSDTQTLDLVGVRAAAQHLELSASTVTRYLQDNPDLNHGDGDGASLETNQLLTNIRHLRQRSRRGSRDGDQLACDHRLPDYAIHCAVAPRPSNPKLQIPPATLATTVPVLWLVHRLGQCQNLFGVSAYFGFPLAGYIPFGADAPKH